MKSSLAGLALCIATLLLFAAMALGIIHQGKLVDVDLAVLQWCRSHSSILGMRLFLGISWLGSPLARIILTIVVAWVLAKLRHFAALAVWIASFFGSELIDGALKHLFHRARPPFAMSVLREYSYSFPSGHALASFVAYGMSAYFLCAYVVKKRSTRTVIVILTAALVVGIGVSRLYLGVHYLSDVIGGYAAGALLLYTCITVLELASPLKERNDDQSHRAA